MIKNQFIINKKALKKNFSISSSIKTIVFILFFLLISLASFSQSVPFPNINLQFEQANNPDQVSSALTIIFLLTVLTLAPSILIMTTSFIRFVIVFSFLRNALGTQQSPPNQILVGLSLFLTFFIMSPVWQQVYNNAWLPYSQGQINQEVAFERTTAPVKSFMAKFTREKDLSLFVRLAKIPRPRNLDDVPIWVIIPAFVLSELKTAFQIGFVIFIPFLVIDMVISSILMAMGMMMLPPILISLPFKLMLFVLADGWYLLVGSLIESFQI